MANEANWALLGEGIIAFARRPRRRAFALPHGLHAMPGPMVVVGERFIDSPAGPYNALAIGEPVRLGLRLGYFFGVSVVNSQDARRAGRQYWGFPHELGKLHWTTDPDKRSIEWEERGLKVEASIDSRPFPFVVPVRTLQHRSDGPVVVPTRLRAMARRARCELFIDGSDDYGWLAGPHRGFVLSGMVLRRHPARQPLGLLSTFRAPLRAPEPGVAGMTRGEFRAEL